MLQAMRGLLYWHSIIYYVYFRRAGPTKTMEESSACGRVIPNLGCFVIIDSCHLLLCSPRVYSPGGSVNDEFCAYLDTASHQILRDYFDSARQFFTTLVLPDCVSISLSQLRFTNLPRSVFGSVLGALAEYTLRACARDQFFVLYLLGAIYVQFLGSCR